MMGSMMPAQMPMLDFPTLDLLQEGIWVTDAADRFVFINAAMGRIAGVDVSLFAGLNLRSLPDRTIRHFLKFFDTARESLRPLEYECPVVTPAGCETWQGGWLTPLIEENRYAGMICTVRDITARKQMELALADREKQLEMALAGSGQALWDWDLTTASIHFSKRWFEMLGYPAEATAAPVDRWKRLFHPNDLIRVEDRVAAHLLGETPILHSEHRVRHKEGYWVTVEATGRITQRDASGNPLRIVGTVQDVSNKKRLNVEGLDLLKQIETLIRNNTTSLHDNKADNDALESLTKRERQILGLIAEGMTSAQIGQHLKLSANTIVSHRKNLMAKLDLHTTAEVTRFAIDHGVLKPKKKP